jgi:hypothetical protein
MSSAAEDSASERLASLKTIEQILDYAIVEGASLRLPLLVYVLSLARMEIDKAMVHEWHAVSNINGAD